MGGCFLFRVMRGPVKTHTHTLCWARTGHLWMYGQVLCVRVPSALPPFPSDTSSPRPYLPNCCTTPLSILWLSKSEPHTHRRTSAHTQTADTMRYRQTNQHFRTSDQQAKDLINNDDVLSTKEQEEVIAYFARSLRVSTQFLKVVVCLHALVALVYVMLLLSGSMLLDLEVDRTATSRMAEVAQQQRAAELSTENGAAATAMSGPPAEASGSTPDPLALLAALDAQQRTANRKYTQDYLARRGETLSGKPMTLTNVLSVAVTLYSSGLLLWATWSGYMACRQLRVNVEDLTGTEPREPGKSAPLQSAAPNRATTAAAAAVARKESIGGQWHALRQRSRTSPPTAQYVIAALAAVASCFWVIALLCRQVAMRAAYVSAGLQAPSIFALTKVSDAALEYVLAVWQPLFHLAVGRLLQSMLDTKKNLLTLSRMKYRFDKV